MAGFQFPDLPVELQVRVLNNADGVTIWNCMRASTQLYDLVRGTSELQYKFELAVSGLADGPPSAVPVRDRLEAVRAYHAKWQAGAVPFRQIMEPLYHGHIDCKDALFLASSPSSALHIHELGMPSAGWEPRTRKVEGWSEHVLSKPGLSTCSLDIAQGLLVVLWNSQYFELETTEYPRCSLLSLSDNFPPHPLARRTEFQASLPVIPEETGSSVSVHGDLIAWDIHRGEDEDSEGEMLVINWKTGVVVWHIRGNLADSCRLIRPDLVLVAADLPETGLHLQAINPVATEDCPIFTYQADDTLCALRFPPMADGVNTMHSFHVRYPAAIPSGARPMFTLDPSFTVVSVELRVSIYLKDEAKEAQSEQYIIFVPLATLFAYSEVPAVASQIGSGGDKNVPRGRRTRVIPWEQWGPHGTRMIVAQGSINWLGARTDTIDWEEEKLEKKVTIYEALPLINVDPLNPFAHLPPSASVPFSDGNRRGDEKETIIPASLFWKEPVRTTFPLRKTEVTIKLEEGTDMWSVAIGQSYDGLLQMER